MVTKIVFGHEHYKNTEILDMLYSLNKECFEPIRDTLFINVCRRNYIEIAQWIIKIYPDKYVLVLEDDCIIEYYIMVSLLLSGNISVEKIELCSICMNENSNCITNCNHQYCYNCINQWYVLKPSCPVCRGELTRCFHICESSLASSSLGLN